ncbi:exosortase-associated protein EpsI, B-type [Chitiniphilus eburneus]|uniref:EpsI family protein n=1 Tax=Chitiniphilus eburneus TaxID=2571148 RepID=A0A4U0PL57_9NEIS|nr:exosortase-associated protein EpsI, B-type [Chitiniphilus eburneus]TJZ67992.1 EpsI family protein [Chitiniphilus eburneus]
MNRSTRWQIPLAILMLAAATLAWAMKPTQSLADARRVTLETMIPQRLGDWRLEASQDVVSLPPELRAKLAQLYTETLGRTYVNSRGERVMLSIAYGRDQSDGLRVHKPDVCYPAQGFVVSQATDGTLDVAGRTLPVRRLVATQGERNEPITYWMTVGDRITLNGTQHKIAQLAYGLRGVIPDGMIFRVSTLGTSPQDEYAVQQRFLGALYEGLPPASRPLFFGATEAS